MEGVLTGSLRAAQEAREQAATLVRQQERQRRKRDLERKRKALEAQILALRAEFDAVAEEGELIGREDHERESALSHGRADMARRRGGDRPATEERT